jgi:hypothetical protein
VDYPNATGDYVVSATLRIRPRRAEGEAPQNLADSLAVDRAPSHFATCTELEGGER